ncbi:uncharacterized protein DUF4432 [Aliiruegeria haliotis]|uniref:Uncharacterized protein DUF4432 n=1 Tax=Aliiruegeria haliotis TaxID=1280846 RepID=A0A2T0RFN0_9RHOB|nr:DUF4432 family protein [Aliiruegeria haliotis]PRY19949.1 uncharacterized protein DUF4432 [Aliiruegeria haliotis]
MNEIADTFRPLPDLPRPARERLPSLVGDLRQLAHTRRIVLADGPDSGQKLIEMSTGGGLDLTIKETGAFDIASVRFRGLPVGWRHPSGDVGNAERALTGFLVTCGLENVRAPRNGLPKHGTLALSPARLLGLGEDWDAARPELFAEGEVTRPHPGGGVLRLHRRIAAPIGGTALTITDTIRSIGAAPAEMFILYHANFGFPLAAPGCTVTLGEATIEQLGEALFGTAPGAPRCHANTTGQRVTIARPPRGDWPGLTVSMDVSADTLPWLQIWRDPRRRRNILAVEPCNCGLAADGTSLSGTLLAPGETWKSSLHFQFRHP